jgi:Rod binding domain-containing protein
MTIGATALATDTAQDTEKLRKTGAGKDFEALLIGQMMRSIREEGSGWMGTGEDKASDAAFGMAENEFARAMAGSGGFGLQKIIEKGLGSPTTSRASE